MLNFALPLEGRGITASPVHPKGKQSPSQRADQPPQLTTPNLAYPTRSLNTATSLHSGTPTSRA
eukprot:1232089-Rhodomonas_salina.1